jgi:hypothetical protein
MRRFTLILTVFFISVCGILAQDTGADKEDQQSPDTASVFFFHADQRWPGASALYHTADTLLTGFQFYDPAEGTDLLNAVNGNIGLAYKPMIFKHHGSSGFRFTPYNFDAYLLNNANIRYYHSFIPYSNIAYSFGKGKEQLFSVTHSQHLARGLSLGIDLRIINSVGLYNRQKSDNSSVAIQGQFISDNERYAVLANYRNNRFKWRENGGITDDSAFISNTETDRKRIATRLSNADNLIKESGFQINQYYYFGRNPRLAERNKSGIDTLQGTVKTGPDSLMQSTLPGKLFFNPERTNFFRHTFTYTRNALLYTDTDPLSGFYNNIYNDSTSTFDSVFFHEFTNQLIFEGGVGKARGSGKAVLLRAGIEHAFSTYKNDTIIRRFNRLTPFAYISANAFGIAKAEGKIWFSNGAPFNGDKGIAAMLTLPAFDNSTSWGNLYASLALDALQPDYIYQFHASNHFSWENSFGQQTILGGKVMYKRKYVQAGFNVYNLDGWVYFDENALPARAEGSVAVSQFYGLADITLGSVGLQAFAVWQNASKPGILRLPDIAGRATATYSVALFKKALYLQTGFSLMYNTAFFADAYMPALRSYHLQSRIKTGNYPYVDGFVNLRVKRARIFLVMKHLNSGLSGYNYFMVPSYPMPDRGFRFGVSWNFFD